MNRVLTSRNRVFRQELINTEPLLCSERANIWTQVFEENENELPIIKAALAFHKTLSNMTISINDYELIVGNQGNGLRAATMNPIVNTWYFDELDRFERRTGSRFLISDSVKEDVRKFTPYWRGRNVFDQTMALLPQDTKDVMDALVFTCGYTLTKGGGHYLINLETVLQHGFAGIEKRVRKKLSESDYASKSGIEVIPFYRSILIVCQGVRVFASRYAALARVQSETATPERKAELLEIARICDKVPYEPPQTFYEAVQTVFFLQLLTQIESDGTGISMGRLDYLLYPFYVRDRDAGIVTKEFAEELLDQLWLKVASIIQIWNEEDSKSFGGHPISQAITLGGQDAHGNDATNELSYMMLETTARVHMAQPSVCCRVHRNTPDAFLHLAAEVIREGLGMPAMYNDEIAIPSLISRGVQVQHARENYAVIGCVEMGIQGKLCAFANSGYFNLAKAFELFLHDGLDPRTGKQLVHPAKRISEMQTYEELEKHFYDCVHELATHQVRVTNVVDTLHGLVAPLPYMSAITEDCIARGKEVQSGGALYNYDGIQGVGFADVVDSLAILKKAVYEEKFFSIQQIIEALDDNFTTQTEMLTVLKKCLLPYGNNDKSTNQIARDLASHFCHVIESHENPRGGFFIPGMYSNSANVPLGSVVGALPNGRLAYKPIAEACSPSHGSEKNGPTQAALSVASLDHLLMTNGSQYNQKYHPSALSGEKGLCSLVDLIQTFFESGGYHIQFNVVSSETLKEAQKHPESYRDLVVRVAGYTAFFTDLSKEIQDDIIDRTELSFGL